MPGSLDADGDLPASAPTAKTLKARAVFGEPHLGHFTDSSLCIDLIRRSNLVWQDSHVYS